jgi:hypothetical protein
MTSTNETFGFYLGVGIAFVLVTIFLQPKKLATSEEKTTEVPSLDISLLNSESSITSGSDGRFEFVTSNENLETVFAMSPNISNDQYVNIFTNLKSLDSLTTALTYMNERTFLNEDKISSLLSKYLNVLQSPEVYDLVNKVFTENLSAFLVPIVLMSLIQPLNHLSSDALTLENIAKFTPSAETTVRTFKVFGGLGQNLQALDISTFTNSASPISKEIMQKAQQNLIQKLSETTKIRGN